MAKTKKNIDESIDEITKETDAESAIVKTENKIDKKQQKEIDDFENELAGFLKKDKKIKVEVSELKEKQNVPYYFDTMNYAFNWVISNDLRLGIPGTKVIDIAGDPSTGKSLIIAKILGNNIASGGSSFVIDSEDNYSLEFISKIVGNEEIAGKIKIINGVKTLEELETTLVKIINFKAASGNQTKMIIAIDSISQLTSNSEIEIATEKTGKIDMKKAQLLKRIFRIIDIKLREANITIITAQHLIAAIGVLFGETKITPGGSGISYASDLKIQLLKAHLIEHPSSAHPLGCRLSIKTTKNRITMFGRRCFVNLLFKSGIDKLSGLPELLVNYAIIDSSAEKITPTTKLSFKDAEIYSIINDRYKKYDVKKKVIPDTIEFTYKNFNQFVADTGEEKLIDYWNKKLSNEVEIIESETVLTGEYSENEE